MGIELARIPRMKRRIPKPAEPGQAAAPRDKMTLNAQLGMLLWVLLWLGYNTSFDYAVSPKFETSPSYFIHGIRAFFPMLATWISIFIAFARGNQVFRWITGPMGLMLMYALVGLVASASYSPSPSVALYFGANYLAIVMVLLAVISVDDPMSDLRHILNLTWNIGFIFTLSLLGAIPFLGSAALTETDTNPVGVRAYGGGTEILGMPGTRNTGFARYAAISALVALPRFMKKGNIFVRIIWGVIFLASLAGLIMANGRTETLAFIAGVAVILGMEKTRRTVNLLVAAGASIVLGLRGFFNAFYMYITRTGVIDPTMTGRTHTWDEAVRYFWDSPWVGFGFQADRYYLGGEHMHNAFLHAYFQAGLLGGTAIVIGVIIVWILIAKYFFFKPPEDRSLIPPEIPAVFMFITISSITESTFAYFSAAWLLSAPIVPYVMALHNHVRKISMKAAWERAARIRQARRESRFLDPRPQLPRPEGV